MLLRRIDEIIDFRKLERESLRFLFAGFLVAVVVNLAAWNLFTMSYGVQRHDYSIPPERIVRVNLRTLRPPPRIPMQVERPETRRQTTTSTTPAPRPGVFPESDFTVQNAPGFEGPHDTYRIADLDSLLQTVFDTDIPEELRLLLTYQPAVIERLYQDMTISRIPDRERNRISLRDELLRPQDLDNGKYQALLVVNPADSRKLSGFIHIPSLILGESLFPPMEIRRAVTGLSEALRMDTGITTTIERQVTLDSLGVKQYPFVLIAAEEPFELSPREQAGLADYLRNGGFVFAEAYGPRLQGMPPAGAASLRRMFHDAIGHDVRPIENSAMIYHSFYDFDDGPPSSDDNQVSIIDGQPIYYLEGAWIGDRLVGIYSEKGYAAHWAEVSEMNAFTRMGVNILLYAMMEQDGMTFRLVDDR